MIASLFRRRAGLAVAPFGLAAILCFAAAFGDPAPAGAFCNPLQPPCCSSPCPVIDASSIAKDSAIGSMLSQANQGYQGITQTLQAKNATTLPSGMGLMQVTPDIHTPELELQGGTSGLAGLTGLGGTNGTPASGVPLGQGNGTLTLSQALANVTGALTTSIAAPTAQQAAAVIAAREANLQAVAATAEARAEDKRAALGKVADGETQMQQQVAAAQSLDDDLKANATLRVALTAAWQERDEMLDDLMELRGAKAAAARTDVLNTTPAGTSAPAGAGAAIIP